jgi:hypothetical protein
MFESVHNLPWRLSSSRHGLARSTQWRRSGRHRGEGDTPTDRQGRTARTTDHHMGRRAGLDGRMGARSASVSRPGCHGYGRTRISDRAAICDAVAECDVRLSDESGDIYLHYLDQSVRSRTDGEHRALCRALLESALADVWCCSLADVHRTKQGKSITYLYSARRTATSRRERRDRSSALAWIDGAPGTAGDPLRWVDVCQALDLSPDAMRRAILGRLASPVRRERKAVRVAGEAVMA